MKFHPDILDQILNLLQQSVSQTSIARQLKISRPSVAYASKHIFNKAVDLLEFTHQSCDTCLQVLSMDHFNRLKNGTRYRTVCQTCETKLFGDQTQFLAQIKELFDQQYGTKAIATKLGCSCHYVQLAFEQLGLKSNLKATARRAYLATEKCCRLCKVIKPVTEFRCEQTKTGSMHYRNACLACDGEINKARCKKNYQEKWDERKEYRERNKERLKQYDMEYRAANKEQLQAKRDARRPQAQTRINEWQRERRKNDPAFKIRGLVSHAIWSALNSRYSSKQDQSCLEFLPFTISELLTHLESQFEPWMNWDNHGKYRRDLWNDDDSTTWTWQIDHIVPHSTFQYASMQDESFQQCWALSNLRPLAAKQNVVDGCTRTRHI